MHLPTSVGGNSYGLAMAERSIGIDSSVVYKNETWLKYPADIVMPLSSNKISEIVMLMKTALSIYRRYDVFHFNFGSTLLDFPRVGMGLFELPMIQRKRLAVTYNGCDAR